MVMLQSCKGITGSGPCKASPLRGEKYCFWHHPDHQAEAEQARKLGGQRRKREGALQGAYDLEGLDSVPGLRRVLELALFDTVNLENSLGRGRLLVAVAQAGARLLETGEQEQRLADVEAALGPRFADTSARQRRDRR